MLRGLFFASFISIMIAVLVSFLPTVEMDQVTMPEQVKKGQEQPVFLNSKPILLEEREVVSFLKQITMNYSFKSIKLENDSMFVDVKVNQAHFKKDSIYEDGYTLLSTIFKQTTNIDRLFIRFILLEGGRDSLLLSITCNEDELLMREMESKVKSHHTLPSFFEKHCKPFYGTGWSDNEDL